MLRSLYIAGTGMLVQRSKMDIITNNIANVETVGYKKDDLLTRSFQEMLISRMNDPVKNQSNQLGSLKTGTHIDELYTSFSQGTFESTEETTDMAIEGDGFFVVQTPQGNRFTRSGNFFVSADGTLVNPDGHFVLSESGSKLTVGTRNFAVDLTGTITADGKSIGKIKVVQFEDTAGLKKTGNNLYEGSGETAAKDGSYAIQQGTIELSNVDVAREMVDMITTNRAFEINQRIVRMLDESLSKTVNNIARF